MGSSSTTSTRGYRMLFNLHAILNLGTLDKITRFWHDDDRKVAWEGEALPGTSVTIDAPDLFGGDESQGGVDGTIDVMGGEPTQGFNSYLQSWLGEFVSAYRDMTTLLYRGNRYSGFYWGNNPYIKPFGVRAQRIYKTSNAAEQWYPAKAGIPAILETFPGEYPQNSAMLLYAPFENSLAVTVGTATFEIGDSDPLDPDATKLTPYGVKFSGRYNGSAGSYVRDTIAGGSANNLGELREYTIGATVRPLNDYAHTAGTRYTIWAADSGFLDIEFSLDENRKPYFMRASAGWDRALRGPTPIAFGQEASIRVEVQEMIAGDVTSGQGRLYVDDELVDTLDGLSTNITEPSNDYNIGKAVGAAAHYFVGYIRKFYVMSGATVEGKAFDMNPAHIIREMLVHPHWGLGYNEADVDDASFTAAADQLYAEGMGISLVWDRATTIEDFIKEIIRHIDAALYVDRQTGLFTLKLIRNDYDVGSLLSFDESNIKSFTDFKRAAFGELVNSVTVNYWNMQTGEDAAVTVDDSALALAQGATVNVAFNYPGFTNGAIARRVAMRDLLSHSVPLVSCTLEVGRIAKNLTIGDAFLLSWEEYEISELPMRVIGIGYGNGESNRIQIKCIQDVFQLPDSAFVADPGEGSGDPTTGDAVPMVNQVAFELPYAKLFAFRSQTEIDSALDDLPELGFVGCAGGNPATNTIFARMMSDAGAGSEYVARMDFCATATLDAGTYTRATTVFPLTNVSGGIAVGTLVQLNNELMEVVSYAAPNLTVKRGVLDTIPSRAHVAGNVLYFWGEAFGIDPTEYVETDSVVVKLLPVTASEVLDEFEYGLTTMTVDLNSRAIRPYPPANVKFATALDPEDTGGGYSGTVAMTWNHRNRVVQADQVLGYTEGSVTAADNTRYALKIYRVDTSALLVEKTDIGPGSASFSLSYTGNIRVDLYTIDNKGESLYTHSFTFAYTSTGGGDVITATTYTPVEEYIIINGGGD
jgi:hypothetical protein